MIRDLDLINRARAWWLGVDVTEVHREQCKIRFEQFGGMKMSKWMYEEIFLNEMNVCEFITLMLSCSRETKRRRRK